MDERQGYKQLYLRDYGQIFNRRKWTIIIILIVAVGLAYGYVSISTKKYTANAQLQLTPQLSSTVQQAQNSAAIAPVVDVPTAIQVIESNSLQQAVQKTVPNAPSVTAKEVQLTAVVTVSVTATNAKLAANAANAYAKAYISQQTTQTVSALSNAEQIIQGHITDLSTQVQNLQAQINVAPLAQQTSLGLKVCRH